MQVLWPSHPVFFSPWLQQKVLNVFEPLVLVASVLMSQGTISGISEIKYQSTQWCVLAILLAVTCCGSCSKYLQQRLRVQPVDSNIYSVVVMSFIAVVFVGSFIGSCLNKRK
jgi:hypothetical protein